MLDTRFETYQQGRRLRVARIGSGPALVLLHGYPDNLQIWSELAPRLAERFEVIAFDWPGMGYSESWPGGATPMHMAEKLLALLDAWRIERANLLGMDMGGQPALAFAATRPDRISSLIVMNSLVFGDEETSWEIGILRKFGWNRFIIRNLAWPVFHRAKRTFLPRGVKLSEELHADMWESFKQKEVRAFIAKMCAGYQGTLTRLPELYDRVCCPSLVLWGEQDKHFPPVHAKRLHESIVNSQLQIIPGAEHWMAWYLADEVARRILNFINLRRGDPAPSGRGGSAASI
jgi:pimeloyl-ACP methyl ester carboxylesterase